MKKIYALKISLCCSVGSGLQGKNGGRERVMRLLTEFILGKVLSWPSIVAVVIQASGLNLGIYYK